MNNALSPTETIKDLKIVQQCSRCKKTVCKAHKIVTVNTNFSISDLSKQVTEDFKKATCKQHPTANLVATYSFYHEEKITPNNSRN